MELSTQEFQLIREYIRGICGLAIPDEKMYLVRQRLQPIAEALHCKTFLEFHACLMHAGRERRQLVDDVIGAITTNETSFFRDGHPFEAFERKILPGLAELVRQRKARVPPRRGAKARIWCAAASTGQEPYSLAMLISEHVAAWRHTGLDETDFEILASDVSSHMLARSMAGAYNQVEVSRGLSRERVEKYFTRHDQLWIIDDAVRQMVEFRQVNLIEPFTRLGGLDVIFCRNVLIYFDDATRKRILEQFHEMLTREGCLFLGATENVYSVTDRFESLREGKTVLYRKRLETAAVPMR